MEPGTRRRTPRSDGALRWWASLDARQGTPGVPPSRPLAAALALAAVAAAGAMPLVWHHLSVPNPSFYGPPTLEVLDGLSADSWLIAVAVIAAALAVRACRQAPSPGTKVVLVVLAFATVNGMFIDYFDWSRRGVSLDTPAFYGPGFFVGLGSAALLVGAAVIGCRARE
jgi:hypothetical protein